MIRFLRKHYFFTGIALWLAVWILGTVGGFFYAVRRYDGRCGEHPCDPHGVGFAVSLVFTFMASLFVGLFAGIVVGIKLEMKSRSNKTIALELP